MPTYGIPSTGITVPVTVSGGVTVSTVPGSDPEGRRLTLGYRPGMPLLVYAVNQLSPPAGLPIGASFTLSSGYVPTPGDGLYEVGANGGSIVTKVAAPSNPYVYGSGSSSGSRSGSSSGSGGTSIPSSLYLARAPINKEVVWLCCPTQSPPDGGLWRWNGTAWTSYLSMPERALQGMDPLFAALDPDKIFGYWARLLGAMQSELALDNYSLLDLFDADRCPSSYLGLLAYQFGVTTSQQDSVMTNRERLRSSVSQNQRRGLNSAISSRLAFLGFKGYANCVYVSPTDPSNYYDLAHATPADAAFVAANNLTIDPTSGQKGDYFLDVPHGTVPVPPYVPSSRLSIHLNLPGGAPLSPTLSASTLLSIKQSVIAALSEGVLSASTTVRFFATDVPSGGSGSSGPSSGSGGGSYYRYF